MNAGSYVGRIGGLAVALGVGAAVFTGHGVAYASTDTDSSASGGASGASGTSGAGSASESSSTAGKSTDSKSGTDETSSDKGSSDKPDADADTSSGTGKKDRHTLWSDLFGGHKPKPSTGTDDPGATPTDGTDQTPSEGTDATPQQGVDDPADAGKTPPKKPRWSWKPAESSPSTSTGDTASTASVDATPTKKPLKSLLANVSVAAPETTKTTSTLVAVSTASATPETTATAVPTATAEASTSTVSQGPLATLFKRFLDAFSGNAPASPSANSPFAWVAAAASRRELNAAAQTKDPTMVWNGYDVVPVGEPTISQFYGEYTMVPAFPGIVQGKQDFNLVDPSTGNTVATVHGLVTYNNDVGSGNRLLQIMVDTVDIVPGGPSLGTAFKDIPRPGSVFASVSNGKYGNIYSALDNPGGKDVVTYKFVTSSFSLPLNPDPYRINFSSANFLYDNVGVNRPVDTQDGYTIKPINDTTPWTAYAAYQPLFNAIQGSNTFGVYKGDQLVGTFDGVVTVTSDFWGTTSEAILVTKAGEGTVGVAAGQVPPVGTIYNIIYWTEDPGNYLLYYAKPNERPGANVTRTVLVDTPKNGKQRTLDLLFRFDGAAPPVRTSLDVPGRNGSGYSLKPVANTFTYSGVNGLPPREAIVQGYQQYKVYDSNNKYLGTVNADVSRQWNLVGNSSEAVLVTGIVDVADGAEVGPDSGKVPPVGSVFNFSYTGTSGFGEAYYALPTDSGKSKTSFQYVTPFGGIPGFKNYDAAKGLGDYNYENPLGGSQNFNLLSASGAESGALLGASQPLCVLDGSACQVGAA